MSEHLKAFLTAWIEWVDAGAVNENPFSRAMGLCCNFEDHLLADGFTWQTAEVEVDALKALFATDKLDPLYPFGGENLYCIELEKNKQHLNEKRLAWVRSKVAQYEVI